MKLKSQRFKFRITSKGNFSDPPRNFRVPDFRNLGPRLRTSRPRNLQRASIKNSKWRPTRAITLNGCEDSLCRNQGLSSNDPISSPEFSGFLVSGWDPTADRGAGELWTRDCQRPREAEKRDPGNEVGNTRASSARSPVGVYL